MTAAAVSPPSFPHKLIFERTKVSPMPHKVLDGPEPKVRTPAKGTFTSKSALLVKPTLKVGFGHQQCVDMRRSGDLVGEIDQIGFVLEMAGINGVGHVDLVGRSVLKLRIWSGGVGYKSQYR